MTATAPPGVRARIESALEAYGHWVARWRWLVLLLSLVTAAGLISGARLLVTDVSFETFLPAGDPSRIEYNEFRNRFGREDAIVVTIEGGDVFDRKFLERLRAFHFAALELPHVDDVTSLINARDTRGERDRLIVEDLLGAWPLDDEGLQAARDRALGNPLYAYNVISPDARFTNVRIDLATFSSLGDADDDALLGFEDSDSGPAEYLTTPESDEFVAHLKQLLDESRAPGFELHAAGMTVMLYDVSRAMQGDMMRFVGSAIGLIAVLLFAIFRRPAGVLLPILVVVLSVGSTMGLMGHFGSPIHVPTQILPSMLLAIGVADAVHLLTIFFREYAGRDDRAASLGKAVGHSGLPVVLTSLTTAGGLVSFASTGVAPVAALGFFAPMGVLFALFYSLTLLPALLMILPIGRGGSRDEGGDVLERSLTAVGEFSVRHARAVLTVTAVLGAIAALGLPRVRFSHDPPRWLPPENTSRLAVELVDREMGGAMTVEVLVEGGAEGALRSPELLGQVARFGDRIEGGSDLGVEAGQTISLADVVKEIHRALNEGRSAYYVVPDSEPLIAQELLLFESSGSDDLEDMVDSQYTLGRVSIRLPWRDAIEYVPMLDAMKQRAVEDIPSAEGIRLTGMLPIITRSMTAVMFGVFSSYGIALAIIVPLMALLLGSVRLGLLSMVPNVVPLLLMVGCMGWFGIPFDAFTMMTGGIALGLVVDDTIHFLHNFARYHGRHGDVARAVRETLTTSGRAITITSIALGTGFAVFLLSSMSNLMGFGGVLALAIGFALLADLAVAPALMAIAMPDSAASTSDAPRG